MAVTLRAERDGVVMSVEGHLDDVAARALLDAARFAVASGDHVTIELRSVEAFTSSAVRDLAVCAQMGAELHFVGHSCSHAAP
jgi:hypothetical protein